MPSKYRHRWFRVIYDSTTLLDTVNVRISQLLEGATTYTAQIDISGPSSLDLAPFTPIRVYDVDLTDPDADGVYEMWPIFTGTVDKIQASGFPNAVQLVCVGPLDQLRRVRKTDYVMTPSVIYEDTDMAKDILDFCGITYTEDNITGVGMRVASRQSPIWRANQSGLELLSELDRVTGCATFELGDGDIVRIPYTPWQPAWADLLATSVQKSLLNKYYFGQSSTYFYEDSRERGGAEGVKNYFKVGGYQWEGAKDQPDEGCNYQIQAEAYKSSSPLGTDIFQGPEDFTSDLIQDENWAGWVGTRLLQWYNRIPDTIKITTMNNHLLQVGELAVVLDPTWGLDLEDATTADPMVYLITGVERENDSMELSCIGGPIGLYDPIKGKTHICCGTENEDGTCTVNDGTDPADPTIPGIGDIPDVPGLPCDPLEDTTCLPGDIPDIPLPPDPEIPWINCVTGDTTPGGPAGPVGCSGAPSGTPCYDQVMIQHTPVAGTGWSCVCEMQTPWRVTGVGSMWYNVEADGTISALHCYTGNPAGILNTEKDPDTQTAATDVIVGPTMAFQATVQFQNSGAQFAIGMVDAANPTIGSLAGGWVIFYAEPGITLLSGGECTFGWFARLSRGPAGVNVCTTARNTSPDILHRNTGSYGGSPGGLNTDLSVGVFIDFSSMLQRITVFGDLGGGYAESERQIDSIVASGFGGPAVYTLDAGDKKCVIQMYAGDGAVPAVGHDTFEVRVKNIELGVAGCEANPRYVPPTSDA